MSPHGDQEMADSSVEAKKEGTADTSTEQQTPQAAVINGKKGMPISD